MAAEDLVAREQMAYAFRVARCEARRAGRHWLQDEAESVALVALAEAARKFDPGRGMSARSWVGLVTKRRVLDWLRAERLDVREGRTRVQDLYSLDDLQGPRWEAHDLEGVDHLTRTMPADRGRFFRLMFVEGYESHEAAGAVGKSPAWGSRVYHDGLELMRPRA